MDGLSFRDIGERFMTTAEAAEATGLDGVHVRDRIRRWQISQFADPRDFRRRLITREDFHRHFGAPRPIEGGKEQQNGA